MKNSGAASGVFMKQPTHMLLFVFFSGDDGKVFISSSIKQLCYFFVLSLLTISWKNTPGLRISPRRGVFNVY